MVYHFILLLLSTCTVVSDRAKAPRQPIDPTQHPGTGRSYRPRLRPRSLEDSTEGFPAMVNALEVMQSEFWDPSTSTWSAGIDWTRAVFSTHVSATLSTIAKYQAGAYQSEIATYFDEVVAFYGGENATSLTQQKYDDMLWVILEWLEAIKFVRYYSSVDSSFEGNHYVPEFAHRARVFWDLASQGYNTSLCEGGMLWTNQLAPYKNAITNQLFLTSSVGMYLYFPGDNDTSSSPLNSPDVTSASLLPMKAHDQRYLNAAIMEYQWLSTSNMTNAQGLYVDGFHITNWTSTTSIGTGKCDARDESIYTYNQGVFLSGVRGLWDATGDSTYLTDGYTLVHNVIAATGWGAKTSSAWAGIGSDGILRDFCDVDGSCSQDAQNFKGIFFHHLALFCEPLALDNQQAQDFVFTATAAKAQDHQSKCDGYAAWVRHNAQAAYRTRNQTGVYGGWWDVPSRSRPRQPVGASDYRNKGIPQNRIWRLPSHPVVSQDGMNPVYNGSSIPDPNERGRGRTVETQSGGLGVMRCFVQMEEKV
ncbi:hypothetical protein D0Z07_6619 [Hyphodiscus hymeniophilus]|uniref:Glycosyl hydrolase n=1 Tax=Hyphodiscus hymeniophilus TaxID=353542 RepID=A0A9P6VGH5_9HELO|nr:hypothetical protein D0Z07_6619 [Hyphodiscus hymeniophilus]